MECNVIKSMLRDLYVLVAQLTQDSGRAASKRLQKIMADNSRPVWVAILHSLEKSWLPAFCTPLRISS
jgi:hypothetical protein